MLELSKIEEFFKCGVISITEVIKKTKKYGTVYFQHGFEKGTILFVTHKKWPFSSDFKVKCEKGEVISGVWKHCPEAEYNAFMCEARTRNIKDDSALKSVENFRNPVTYIHGPTLARNIGTSSSFHNWRKSKLAPNDTVVTETSVPTSSKNTQPTVSLSCSLTQIIIPNYFVLYFFYLRKS